jgi:hypothetical protein
MSEGGTFPAHPPRTRRAPDGKSLRRYRMCSRHIHYARTAPGGICGKGDLDSRAPTAETAAYSPPTTPRLSNTKQAPS